MRNRNLVLVLAAALACGLIGPGCGGDDDTASPDTVPQIEDLQAPQDAQEAIDQLPQDIDEIVQQCLDNVDGSELPEDQKQDLRDLCESSGKVAREGLENLPSQPGE